MAVNIKYTIAGGKGKRKVKFSCPRCSIDMESPLQEAGDKFPCVQCGIELVVPGTAERQVEAQRELDLREAERRATEERKVKEANDAEHFKAHTREQQRIWEAEEAKRKQSAPPKQNQRSAMVYAAWSFGSVAIAAILVFSLWIRPLQRRLTETANALHASEDKVEALESTVTHNADIANRNTSVVATSVSELTTTVNHNADIANRNTSVVATSVSELTTTVNHNARSLDSLTDTVNENARITNMNNSMR